MTSRWAEMSQPEHQKLNKLHQDSECPLPGRRCGLNESTSCRKNDLCVAYQREDSYPERMENAPYSRREKHTAQSSPGGRCEETGGQLKSVAKQDTHVSPSEVLACTCWNGCSEKIHPIKRRGGRGSADHQGLWLGTHAGTAPREEQLDGLLQVKRTPTAGSSTLPPGEKKPASKPRLARECSQQTA